MLSGSALVAVSLGRSLRRHRSRAISAVLAGALGVALTTAILVLTGAVTDAIRGASLDVPGAQWVAAARSSSGMSDSLTVRAAAVPGVHVAELIRVSTRDATSQDPLLVVGVTDAIATFAAQPSALSSLAATAPDGAADGMPILASRTWAAAHDVDVGDTISLEAPGGVEPAHIVGLLDRPVVRSDNVVLAAFADVAAVFDRPGVTDGVLVQSDRADQAALREEIDAAFGGAASVVRPQDSASSYERSFKSVRTILSLFAFMSALVAASVVFFCWRVTLDDARPSISRLRLVGAHHGALSAGAAMVLLPIVALSTAIGTPIGLVLGANLSGFTNDLVKLTQLAVESHAPMRGPALGGALVAIAVFAIALASSVRTITKIPVIDAVVTGRPQ
ncbi:MAG: FtsX-like permease family protein [Ilumatobacteraceae bacterium]